MPHVNISVHGRPYTLRCGEGEEGHVADLARYVDAQIARLAESGVRGSETHMILLAALMIADELTDARNRLDEADATPAALPPDAIDAATATQLIEKTAHRIEAIAARLAAT